MKKTATLIFSLLAISCAAQRRDTYPFYFYSAVLEFGSPLTYFHDLSRKPPNTIKLPATFIGGEFRIKNKFYIEGGLGLGSSITSVIISRPESSNPFNYKSFDATCFAGGLFKLKLFRNFYFTPSLDFYYSKRRAFYGDSLIRNVNIYSIGPTVGFEYFLLKRISINTDITNLNIGLGFDNTYHPPPNNSSSFIQEHGLFTFYRMISLGIHYNFDWKKQRSNVTEAK